LVLYPEVEVLFSFIGDINAHAVFSLIKLPPALSEKEQTALFYFFKYLLNAELGLLPDFEGSPYTLNIKDVYQWLTGSSTFIRNASPITLTFRANAEGDLETVPRPVIKTCIPSLTLPVAISYEKMEAVCSEAIINSITHGFTLM